MNIKICVYAICKNEFNFVDKWLDNMSEADYIVILDTGSKDGTYKKLKNDKRVTRIERKIIKPFRFDVARNESMKLIPDDADVLVCTDFDELFEPGWAQIIRNNWFEGCNRIYYRYAWSHDETNHPTDVFTYDKIHTKDFHWKFPVHEVCVPNTGILEKGIDVGDSIFLHHYPDKSKSRSFYFDLLKLAVKENPTDCHEQMLLGREYLLAHDWKNALDNYLKAIQMPDIENPEKRLVLLESLGRIGDCYTMLQNYDEAIWYYQEWIKEDFTYREPYLMLAEKYNDMHMYTLAIAMVDTANKYATRKYNWIERSCSWGTQAEDILSIAYYNLGDIDKAIENIKVCLEYHPDDVRLLKNYNLFLEAKLSKVTSKDI